MLNENAGVISPVGPGVEFSQNNCGEIEPTTVLDETVDQAARAFQVRRADIGVEQVAYSGSSREVICSRS